MNKYDKWNISDYEANVNKACFLDFLFFLKNCGKRKQILRVIKASGCLISYNENFMVKEESMRRIEKFVKNELSEGENTIYTNYVREAKLLNDKRAYISNVIDKYLESYNINIYDLINGVNSKISSIENIEMEYGYLVNSTKEYVLFSFGALLKHLKYYSRNESKIVRVNKKLMDELINFANALHEINEIIQAWMFGEITIYMDENGLYTSECTKKNTINKDRLLSAMMFWDIKDAKEMSYELEQKLCGESELVVYRKCLEDKIREYFYTKDFNTVYLGVKLQNWINAYTYFFKMAKENAGSYKELNKNVLKDALKENGITDEESEIILNTFEFKKNAKDIYDAFLIPQNDKVIFVASVFENIDPSRAMMSIFGMDKNSEIAKKGEAFEKHIYSLIRKCGVKIISNINGSIDDEKYEIDLLFIIDKTLFVCECKTQMQHENMRGYYRNLIELDYYIAKFKRNIDFFFKSEKGKKIVELRLKEEIDINEINNIEYIFISNIFYPQNIYDNIYITDETSIYKYFMRQPSVVHEFFPQNNQCNTYKLFSEFYEGAIGADKFVQFLLNKENEVKLYNQRIRIWQNSSMEKLFQVCEERFVIDDNFF